MLRGNKRKKWVICTLGFPHSSVGKESACNAGDLGSIPGLGKPPGEGNGNPFQYSCLENPMDRGAWPWDHKRGRHDLGTKQQILKDRGMSFFLFSSSILKLSIVKMNKIDTINSSDKHRYFRLLSKKLDSKEIN